MDRTYQLQFCKVCKNSRFSTQHGIICGLTRKPAEFKQSCEHFLEVENTKDMSSKPITVGASRASRQNFGNLLSGYLVSLYSALAIFAFAGIIGLSGLSILIMFFGSLIALGSIIMAISMLYKLWSYIIVEYSIQGLKLPVKSAGQAIGYLFIPFFNLYWVFVAIGQLPICLNELARTRQVKINIGANLGFIIGFLSPLAIIPYAGTFFGLVSAFILMPVLLTKAIKSIALIPPYTRSTVGGLHITEKIDSAEIRDFRMLFKTDDQGYNFKFGFLFIIAALLYNLTYNLINNGLSFDNYKEIYSYAYLFFDAFFIFALILISGSVNKLLFVIFSALFYTISAAGSMAVFFWNYKHSILGTFWGFMNINTILSYIVYGVLFAVSLDFVVSKWGIKFCAILIAILTASVSNQIIWIAENIINSEEFDFNYESLLFSVLHVVFISISIYVGFKWHVNWTSGYIFNSQPKEILDYNLE